MICTISSVAVRVRMARLRTSSATTADLLAVAGQRLYHVVSLAQAAEELILAADHALQGGLHGGEGLAGGGAAIGALAGTGGDLLHCCGHLVDRADNHFQCFLLLIEAAAGASGGAENVTAGITHRLAGLA